MLHHSAYHAMLKASAHMNMMRMTKMAMVMMMMMRTGMTMRRRMVMMIMMRRIFMMRRRWIALWCLMTYSGGWGSDRGTLPSRYDDDVDGALHMMMIIMI